MFGYGENFELAHQPLLLQAMALMLCTVFPDGGAAERSASRNMHNFVKQKEEGQHTFPRMNSQLQIFFLNYGLCHLLVFHQIKIHYPELSSFS